MTSDINKLPPNLPAPVDDGATKYLQGMRLPDLSMPATDGSNVNVSGLKGTLVLYCYPMTGRPNVALPEGWDDIPGARGCTPQSCAFRDHYQELQALHADVLGISTQTTAYQQEMAQRLHLPFRVLSDADLHFSRALNMPLMSVEGMTLMKRVTLIARDGMIVKVFYPVFPTHEDAPRVLQWLRDNP